MTVTLLRFELGGEYRWGFAGLVTAALFSVTPGGLICLWFGVALGAFWACFRPVLRTAYLAFLACFAAVIAAAVLAPTKAGDQRIDVSATVLPLSQLAEELRLGDIPYDAVVVLPSRKPSWDEIDRAIASQTRLRLRASYCSFGASLLSGAYAYGRHLEAQ